MSPSAPISLLGPPEIQPQQQPPPIGLTENHSPTFLSTSDHCLDFFFHVVPNTPSKTLTHRLMLAWSQDPLKALKLVCHLRGVRGTGKSDKKGGHTAVLWLHKHHPKTLACNVSSFADFGYSKDLLEILSCLLGAPEQKRKKLSHQERRIESAKKVVERFNTDPDFKFLHERVSDYFAMCLRSDLKLLSSGELNKISLAAKWCPSLDSSYDVITLLCESIGRKVFPREEYSEYEGVEEAHYAYRVRDRLRKEVLVPLRKALELPEVYIGANDWGSIPYNRVASVAMKTYKDKFIEHDEERFEEYLEKVKNGEAKIAAGALLPHEIIASLKDYNGAQVAELQWERMVDDIAKKGRLNNCMAICDVSRSMEGTPMEVSVALGILVSELSEEPWKGKLITFSANPKLQRVKGSSLKEKTGFVRRMEWMINTDFKKVFRLLLRVAVNGKLKPEEMIKRLFVFSDMEFDKAREKKKGTISWETDYQWIVRKFTKRGYGDHVPEIVFWNLRDSKATPVLAKQPGVALVSGFSKNLMTLFLKEGKSLSPLGVMNDAISGEEYKKLLVLD